MSDQLLKSRLAELSAAAESTRLKLENNQHWERELLQECNRLSNLASECSRLASQHRESAS